MSGDGMIQATIIGTGDGGIATTPPGKANITYTYVSPLIAVLVRTAKAYLASVLGLLTTGATTDLIPAHSFLELLKHCMDLSVGAAVVIAIGSIVSLLTKLEEKFPSFGA